jgi:hypothetical protein
VEGLVNKRFSSFAVPKSALWASTSVFDQKSSGIVENLIICQTVRLCLAGVRISGAEPGNWWHKPPELHS